MQHTLYRRPLPADAIAFASREGQRVFAEALAAGSLDGYFPLAEQFHTQSDPSFCGLGSLVVALNALAIDPGRLWRGPWRWFGEDLLDCCVPLDEVRARGLDLDELACLARCNGADVALLRAATGTLTAWRTALTDAAKGRVVVIASYDRAALGQTGSGHFSPIGGYHATRDLALILDVARFKYPPHWVPAERLWTAMRRLDPATNKPRGWLTLTARGVASSLGFTLSCKGEDWPSITRALDSAVRSLAEAPDIQEAVKAVLPIAAYLEHRAPTSAAHAEALKGAQASLRSLDLYLKVAESVRGEDADKVTLLVLALAGLVPGARGALLDSLRAQQGLLGAYSAEIESIRTQLDALRTYAHLS
jgi:glutathione gamma-glutamylcysteinyltransferase